MEVMERVAEHEDTLEGLLADLGMAEHVEAQIWMLRLDQAGVPPLTKGRALTGSYLLHLDRWGPSS